MLRKAETLGVQLRPHVKTHKCVEIAQMQLGAERGPITVSTMAEARHFIDHGFSDILLAVPLPPVKVKEAVVAKLGVLVDSLEALEAIEAVEKIDQGPVRVWLKVDCGYGRAGVVPGTPEAVSLASRLSRSERINFRGLLTHGGHSYDCVGPSQIRRVAAEERDSVVQFASQLRQKGISVDEVSVGSTPTMMHVDHLEGVTEIRPGNYALFDGFQSAIGSCSPSDIAAHVLCSVIGVYPGRLVLDVGALALSKDPGPTHVDPDCGYGRLLDLKHEPVANLRLTGLSQEHGKAYGTGAQNFQVGDRLIVVPNHSCLTMACFPQVHAFRNNQPTGLLTPVRGW